MRVGLIGFGYWGTKYAKLLTSMEDVELVWICKRSIEGYSNEKIKFTTNIDDVLYDNTIDCVIVATPSSTHTKITEQCINAGKHALIEKPFTITSLGAGELIEMNKEKNLILMPGHIYLHHPAIKKIKELIDFDVENVFAKRLSLSKYPDAITELALHDIYILRYLFGDSYSVKSVIGPMNHKIFNLSFYNTQAYVEASSDYPGKIRELLIRGDKKRIFFDEVNSNYITVTDLDTKEVEFFDYTESTTPLENQCRHFFNCILGKEKPIVDEYDGLFTIEIIENIIKKGRT